MQPDRSIVANETVSALSPASDLAVSPETNHLPAGNDTVLSASNAIAPKLFNGKSPKRAWLAAHKFDGADFTSQGPQHSFEDITHRALPSRDSFESPSRLRGSLSSFSPPPGKAPRSGRDVLVAIALAGFLVVGLKTFSRGVWHDKVVTEDQQGRHSRQEPSITKSKIESAKHAAVPSVTEADKALRI